MIGFEQSDVRTNEYIIKPEMLHLKWINARIPVKEGYISLKLRIDGESEIDIPDKCTVKVVAQNSRSFVLKKKGTFKFVLDSN